MCSAAVWGHNSSTSSNSPGGPQTRKSLGNGPGTVHSTEIGCRSLDSCPHCSPESSRRCQGLDTTRCIARIRPCEETGLSKTSPVILRRPFRATATGIPPIAASQCFSRVQKRRPFSTTALLTCQLFSRWITASEVHRRGRREYRAQSMKCYRAHLNSVERSRYRHNTGPRALPFSIEAIPCATGWWTVTVC